MNIAIFGALVGIMSAIGSRFVPGISGIDTALIYLIVSMFTTTWHAALAWHLQPDLPDHR